MFRVDYFQKCIWGNVRKRRVGITACCQRKEPRARSNFRRFAVSRSCRRSSRMIVNVIKLKKGTIEITASRTCKNGLTVSQSRNGRMPLHSTIVMELELSDRVPRTRLCASSSSAANSALSAMQPTIPQGHLRILSSEAKSDSDLPQTIILKSESYNFMCCCPGLSQSQSRGGWFHL